MSQNTELQIYLVGGAVRDELLSLPVTDRDWVVVGATPTSMQDLGYRQVGKDFPVFLHPDNGEEYALARTERKISAGHRGFTFDVSGDVTLEEDLQRRDLTINAIAKDGDGNFIDPYGGKKDIEARILRHVSGAFREDPLRVLRVARFAAKLKPLGFSVAEETMQLMSEIAASGELQTLSVERVWTEFQTALAYPDPQPFISELRMCGALAVLFPEFDQLYGVPQQEEIHLEIDCGVHTEMVLQQVCKITNKPEARYAALCHDLGKATTAPEDLPKHPGHEQRGADIASELSKRLRAPNDFRELAVLTARFHSHCHRAKELTAEELLTLLVQTDALRRAERFETFLHVCEADNRGRLGFENQSYPQANYLRRALQAVNSLDTQLIATNAKQQDEDIADAIQQSRLAALREYCRSNAL